MEVLKCHRIALERLQGYLEKKESIFKILKHSKIIDGMDFIKN